MTMSINDWINRSLGPLALAACALLAGCGESTNIAPDGTGTVSNCSSLVGVTCVTGRFVDDAVFNLDYECSTSRGAVRGTTGADGSFSCPLGSQVLFSLINPDDRALRIDIAQIPVRLPAQIYGESSAYPVYFWVTPRLLAGDLAGAAPSFYALNIARFLQTLSEDDTDDTLANWLPSRRIIISDADKRAITEDNLFALDAFKLEPAATPATPAPSTFDDAARDYLTALADIDKHALIPSAQAEIALSKSANNAAAGIYIVPGGSLLALGQFDPDTVSFDADYGAMVGLDTVNSKRFVGSLTALVDRRGRVIAGGVYSYGAPVVPSDAWQLWSDPQGMTLTSTGSTDAGGFPLWPVSRNLNQFVFTLKGAADTGREVAITQGVMEREAVAGSEVAHGTYFKESGLPTDYGRWQLRDASSTLVPAGAYSLVHSFTVASLMNPDLWKAPVVTFPLPITVSIYNTDFENTAPECTGGRGCEIAKLRMVILEDGNIISDRNQTCGAGVNPDSLRVNDDPARQELPLGVVANILDTLSDGSIGTITAMTLFAMLPDDARLADSMEVLSGYEEFIPYLQFDSNQGGNSLLRVDGPVGQFDMYGFCPLEFVQAELCDVADKFQPGVATWSNEVTLLRYVGANIADPDAPATDRLRVNRNGFLSARKTDAADCVAP